MELGEKIPWSDRIYIFHNFSDGISDIGVARLLSLQSQAVVLGPSV